MLQATRGIRDSGNRRQTMGPANQYHISQYHSLLQYQVGQSAINSATRNSSKSKGWETDDVQVGKV